MVAVGIVNHGSWSSGTGDSVDANKKIIYSNDGVNWNFASTVLTQIIQETRLVIQVGETPEHVVYSSYHNRFVTVCRGDIGHITGHRSADLIHYSSNGSSWSQASAPGGYQLFSLAVSSGGQFVATGRGDGPLFNLIKWYELVSGRKHRRLIIILIRGAGLEMEMEFSSPLGVLMLQTVQMQQDLLTGI